MSEDMVKPFEIHRTKAGRKVTMEEAMAMVSELQGESDHPVEKPFVTKFDPDVKQKMYLILWERTVDNGENEHDWQFFNGTTQSLYSYIRDQIILGEEEHCYPIDVMKSRLLVDSPKIPLSKHVSIYLFMKDMIIKEKVTEDSNFDIENYYYDEEEDLNGQEE